MKQGQACGPEAQDRDYISGGDRLTHGSLLGIGLSQVRHGIGNELGVGFQRGSCENEGKMEKLKADTDGSTTCSGFESQLYHRLS